MQYRRMGRSGLKLSVLSFGSWVTFGPQLAGNSARECLAAAYDAGINFFDNAEVYAGGQSETIMGESIRQLGWPRHTYVISSKYFWGIEDSVNTRNTLNRKYLLQAVEGSLRRMGLDFLDLIYCHRADPETPIDETVWAMHDIIESGRALYWGTSEWSAAAIREAWAVAERDHLHRPVVEQPQYNLLNRHTVEEELAHVCRELGIGLTTWSPLASGLLSGKYLDGVPEGSRATLPGYGWLRTMLTDPEANQRVRSLKEIADGLGVSLSQLSIAWCAANPLVSSVITGASGVEQVRENLGALDALHRLTPDVLARIDGIFT
ncbi:MAG TPA: aldo/keto reductase [Candidatus Dormibacteraeota bacterium]|nr:aldo/keto reductase [Candidatus Dormibacteraeota bacterium]